MTKIATLLFAICLALLISLLAGCQSIPGGTTATITPDGTVYLQVPIYRVAPTK
jgi:hypothetical protein